MLLFVQCLDIICDPLFPLLYHHPQPYKTCKFMSECYLFYLQNTSGITSFSPSPLPPIVPASFLPCCYRCNSPPKVYTFLLLFPITHCVQHPDWPAQYNLDQDMLWLIKVSKSIFLLINQNSFIFFYHRLSCNMQCRFYSFLQLHHILFLSPLSLGTLPLTLAPQLGQICLQPRAFTLILLPPKKLSPTLCIVGSSLSYKSQFPCHLFS